MKRFIYVYITLGLLAVVLLFSADPLLGAVGLRVIYRPLGVSTGFFSIALILFVSLYDRMVNEDKLIYLGVAAFVVLFLTVMFLTVNFLSVFMFVVGWITGIVTGAIFIPAYIIVLIFGLYATLQFFISFRKPGKKTLAKNLSTLILSYSIGYFIGMGENRDFATKSEIRGRLVHQDHQYFLYLEWEWLDDEDFELLTLYQCNQIGIACEITYKAPTGYYRNAELSIRIDDQTQTVGVQIDNQFSPIELTEADIKFLCNFFDVPANDSFCSGDKFQDRRTFRRMLNRKIDDISYDSVTSYFEKAGTLAESNCEPPEKALVDSDNRLVRCQLRFPGEHPYYLELRMSDSSELNWYDINLIIPEFENE